MPYTGTPMARYYEELKLKEIFRERPDSDPVEVDGKMYMKFWEGETETSAKEKQKYQRIEAFFKKLCAEKERPFPFIPALNPAQLKSVRREVL